MDSTFTPPLSQKRFFGNKLKEEGKEPFAKTRSKIRQLGHLETANHIPLPGNDAYDTYISTLQDFLSEAD